MLFEGSAPKIGGVKIVREKVNDAAALAALKRQRFNAVATSSSSSKGTDTSSGYKLGGSMSGQHLSAAQLRQLTFEATERRIKDDKWCPTQSQDNLFQNDLDYGLQGDPVSTADSIGER